MVMYCLKDTKDEGENNENLHFGFPEKCDEIQGSQRVKMKYVHYFILQLLFCYNCLFNEEEKKRPLLRGNMEVTDSGPFVICLAKIVPIGVQTRIIFLYAASQQKMKLQNFAIRLQDFWYE